MQVTRAGEQHSSQTVTSTEGPKPKDRWDKVDILGKILGSILIPGVIAVATYYLNAALQDRATKQKQVETAITILQSPKSDDLPALKSWALKEVNEALNLPPGAQLELQTSPLPGASPAPPIQLHPPEPAFIADLRNKLQGDEKKWMTVSIV